MVFHKKRYVATLFLAFVTLSINLRAPITALPPIIKDIQQSLHMGATVSGLLTTIPVLCFGLFTPLASKLIIRTGLEKAIILTLLGVMAGSLIRVVGNVPMMLIGTVIIGLSLTVGNLLGILIIGRDFKQSAGIMTGIMVLGMSLGGMITSSLTPPLAQYTNWQLALSSWFLLALICLLFWVKTMTSRTHRAREVLDNLSITPKNQAEETEHHSNSKRDKAILFLIIAFACHCFAFYGIVAWLPRFLIDRGMSANRAGLAVSVFHMLGFIGALGIPILAKRLKLSSAALFAISGTTWFLVPTGFYLAPDLWLLWNVMGGIGCGGAYVVVFMAILALADTLNENRRISTVVQCSGYIIASFAPLVVGGLYEFSDTWLSSFTLMGAATAVFMGSGIAADLLFRKDNDV